MTASFLVLYFLTSVFVQKWYFPQGNGIVPVKVVILDTDRDANVELIFTSYGSWPAYLHFYEFQAPDQWLMDSCLLPSADLLWDGGDFDGDGLHDLILQFHVENPSVADGIMIFESPDSFSYPTQEAWRDTVGFALVQPISAYDVDKDSYPEIFKLGWMKDDSITVYYPFGVYEYMGNNLYDTVFMADTTLGSLSSTMAFGDYDADSLTEFVLGNIDGYYQIWECVGNNDYQCLIQQQLPTANIKDCLTVPDADQDGKPEFMVKGFTVPDGKLQTFIFEATGNNTYTIIKPFEFSWSSFQYGGGYSEAEDVDGDSVPEIVLEACQNIYVIKSGGNDSFYVWDTLPGNSSGSSIRVTNDLDHNGLNEIVVSGNNQTRIYEKTPEVTWFCPVRYDTFYANDTVHPRWKLDETIALDTLRLYWAHPQLGCHLLYTGLPTDTTCSWVVPDTQSNMAFRLWLTIKGQGRYDSTYSPPFYVKRQSNITEVLPMIPSLGLKISPNPFREKIVICGYPTRKYESMSLEIHDAAGRLIKSFLLPASKTLEPFSVSWDGTDCLGHKVSSGVYFIQIKTCDGSILTIDKTVKLK